LESWCPDGGPIQHTIWFTFAGPTSGMITIDAHTDGFNDRIAVYEADSANAVLSGKYTLVAANDDRSSTDSTALLTDISVESGKLYWMQVDGYNGETGNLTYINLISNDLLLFPNPTTGPMTVYMSNVQDGNAIVEIHSSIGLLVYSNIYPVTTLNNKVTLNIPSLSTGIYFIKVTINGTAYNKMFIKI
jgi:hypothetical protein